LISRTRLVDQFPFGSVNLSLQVVPPPHRYPLPSSGPSFLTRTIHGLERAGVWQLISRINGE
ncbi:hypothetical protein FRC18_005962, partial [Serendipita sp. 400]